MLMTTAGQIGIDLVLNSAGFKRQLKSINSVANSASNKISSNFKQIGVAVVAAFSVKKIVDFGKSCVDLGSDLAEVQNVVDVTFKSMSSSVDKWAKSARTQFGLSETMAKKYVGAFGSMAEAFGFSEKQAYNMSTALAGLSGDVASFYNITQDEAYTKLKSVFSGETETLKDLGIVMTQNALDAYALANGYGKTTSAMTEAEKVSLRFAFVQDQLKNATGDFARTQDSWANQTRILQLRWESFKATIGKSFIAVMSPLIKTFNVFLEKINECADSFNNFMSKSFGIDLGNSASSTGQAMATTADETDGLADSLDNANQKAEKLAGSLASFDKLNIITQNTSVPENKTQNQSLPSNLVNNNSAVDKAKNKVNALARSLKNLGFDKVKKSASLAFKNILDGIKQIANSWKNVWGNGSGKRLLSHINNLLSTAFGIIGDIASAFTQAWTKAGLGDSVVQSIVDRVDSLIQLIDTVGRDFRLAWNDGTGERIWSNILEYVRNTNNCVATFRRKIKEAWDKNGTGKKIWGDILGIVENITGFLKDMAKIRLDWLENLDLSPLLKSVEKLLGAFRRLSKACGEQLKSAYKNVLLPLAKWTIEKAVPGLVDMLGEALDFIGDVVNEISPSTLKGIAVGIAAVGTAVAVFKTGKAISDGIGAVSGALKGLMSAIEAHPVVAGLTAVASAITMLVGAIKSANETKMQDLGFTQATEEMSAYVDAITNCKQEINDLCGEMTSSLTETSNNMGVIDRYKDRLDKLLQKANLSPEEQAELTTIGDYFSKKYPEFKKAWNKYIKKNSNGTITITGKIDKVKENLDGLIEKYKQVAAASALSSLSETNTEGIVKAQGKFTKAAQSYKDAVGKLAEFESEWNLSGNKQKKALYDDPGYYVWHNRGYYLDADDGHVVQTTGKQSTLSDLRDQYDKLKKKASEAKQAYLDTSKSTAQLEKDNSDLSKMQAVVNGNYKDATAVLMAYNASLISSSDIEKSKWKSLKNLRNVVKKSGKNAVYGYTDGISRKEINSVAKKGIEMAGGFIKALNGPYGLDEHSPSKKTKKSARYAVLGFNNGITDNLKTMKKPLQKMLNKIKSPFRNVGTWFRNIFKGAWNGIKSVFSGVGKWFKNLFNGILKFIKAPINFLIDGLNTLIKGVNKISFDVPKWVPGIGGKKFGFDIPQIPHLAKGGLVKAPTLAVVGDNMGASSGNPEVVSPLNKLKGMIQESSDNGDTEILSQILLYLKRMYEMFIIFRNKGGNTYEFVAKINGSDIFKEIVKQNEMYKKRHNGKSAFV